MQICLLSTECISKIATPEITLSTIKKVEIKIPITLKIRIRSSLVCQECPVPALLVSLDSLEILFDLILQHFTGAWVSSHQWHLPDIVAIGQFLKDLQGHCCQQM
jgi:hypothetical protein